jgi:Chaperone for flagella basal body P-ring formation
MHRGQRIFLRIVTAFFAVALGSLLAASEIAKASGSIAALRRVSIDEVRQLVIGELHSPTNEEKSPSLDDIELPLAVPMRTGSSLRVRSVCWDQDAQRVRFQLACTHPGECLPFLAYVRTASGGAFAGCRQESSPHAARSAAGPVVRAGGRATAVLSSSGIRINAAVTCLQGGNLGNIIRVRGREGRIFPARVIGPSLVEAGFE